MHRKVETMAETQIWRVFRMRTAVGRAPVTSRKSSNSRRTGLRLWTLLNAQSLIDGTIGGQYDAAFIEDDRRRLATAPPEG